MNKRLFVVGLVIVSLCANVFAFVGPPTAELKKGQWSGGFNYSYSSQDLEKKNVKWAWFDDGVLEDSGVNKVKFKDVKTQMYYGNIGYGVEDWWQVYIQLGVADVKANVKPYENDYYDEEFGANFDNDFIWGWGTKVTFAKQDKVDWGATVQMNWLDTEWSEKGSDSGEGFSESWKDTIDLKAHDLLVAAGPTVDMGGWKLYGGPFFYYLSGDFKGKEVGSGSDEGGDFTWLGKASGDLRAENNFGGYIGTQFEIAKNWNFTVEYGTTGDGWNLASGVAVKF